QNVDFPTLTNTDKETWNPLPVISFAGYNIYRGLLSQLSPAFYGTCETQLDPLTPFPPGGTNFDTQFIDFDLPAVGAGFFYLITGDDHTACVSDMGVFEVNGESPLGDAQMGPLQSDRIPRLDPANTCMLTCFDYF
ncbi:MAG: hypothetical protein O6947_07955, partial [Acidobacteria bacterium]|nr:hypothetical protein [Acidobacteriota bacterium]